MVTTKLDPRTCATLPVFMHSQGVTLSLHSPGVPGTLGLIALKWLRPLRSVLSMSPVAASLCWCTSEPAILWRLMKWRNWTQKSMGLENVPRTQAALRQHIKRANIWNEALVPDPEPPSPCDWGLDGRHSGPPFQKHLNPATNWYTVGARRYARRGAPGNQAALEGPCSCSGDCYRTYTENRRGKPWTTHDP